MIVVFALGIVGGFGAIVLASQRAVGSATQLALGSDLPPFFIGITLLAVGTDLPEIANSIAASVSDHGDVNVGDSIGSAATQATLILGLLPIVTGSLAVPQRGIVSTGAATVAALALVAALLSDGHLGRPDAAALLVLWAGGSWVIFRRTAEDQQTRIPTESESPRVRLVVETVLALAAVAGAAAISVWAIVGLSDELGAPEFVVSFFLASIGTSLPELVFDLTALRQGEVALAVGDVMGSSFVDATLSIAIGPLLAPTEITTSEVEPAVISALLALVLVGLLMARIRCHDWRSGALLLAIYAGFFVVLL